MTLGQYDTSTSTRGKNATHAASSRLITHGVRAGRWSRTVAKRTTSPSLLSSHRGDATHTIRLDVFDGAAKVREGEKESANE